MTDARIDDLAAVKARRWFYSFDLPDGSQTKSDMPPEIAHIHTSRRDKMVRVIREHVPDAAQCSALDFASHEGYFSVELARHFGSVLGLEVRPDSIEAARLITRAVGATNVRYEQADLQDMKFDPTLCADFVLVYGLLYHLENPIHTLRLATQLCRRCLLIESQVFPYDMSGMIEDGHYRWQRGVHGVFSLSADYAKHREGGSTDLALVPSLNALLFLPQTFGFPQTEVLKPDAEDYEQFRRGSRVVILARK